MGTCTARLAVLLQRFSYNTELQASCCHLNLAPHSRRAFESRVAYGMRHWQYVVLRIFRLLCAAEETVSLLVGTDLMDTTIELLDAAVKTEDR